MRDVMLSTEFIWLAMDCGMTNPLDVRVIDKTRPLIHRHFHEIRECTRLGRPYLSHQLQRGLVLSLMLAFFVALVGIYCARISFSSHKNYHKKL